jgi:FkbM family methyltransferase
VRRLVKNLAWTAGYEIRRRPAEHSVGYDSAFDIRRLLEGRPRPIVLDVGANTGQSAVLFRRLFPHSELHCFEPGSSAFAELQENARTLGDIRLNNVAVGAAPGTQQFLENVESDMSSFLPLGEAGWGAVRGTVDVSVITLDDYCAQTGIEHVDLLKSDTQGYELEVLKGADRLLQEKRISLVYFEVIFSELYEGLPDFDVLYRFLRERSMRLVALYNYRVHEGGFTGWCDALFARVR